MNKLTEKRRKVLKLLNLLKFKKALILVFVFSITITLIPTNKIYANEIASEISDNIIEINDPQTGYSGKLETVYLDNGIYKYNIDEFGDSYSLIIDTIQNKYIVDDKILSKEEYDIIIAQQLSSLKNRSTDKKSLSKLVSTYPSTTGIVQEYDDKHEEYKYNIQNHIHSLKERCMACPLHTTAIPTSGYRTNEYDLGVQEQKFTFSLAAGAISAVAAYLTFGATKPVTVLISGLFGALGGGVTSRVGIGRYHSKQSLHSVCYKAVKEKRIVWVIDQITGINKSDTTDNYFYSSNPN